MSAWRRSTATIEPGQRADEARPGPREGAGPSSFVKARAARPGTATRQSLTRSQLPISPTMPRRKASTQSTKMAPWITVTQAPNSAR